MATRWFARGGLIPIAAAAAAGLALAGCGPHVSNGQGGGQCEAGPCPGDANLGPGDTLAWPPDTLPAPHVLTAIQVMPVNPILFVDCGTAKTQMFTALGIYADGKNADVTAMATWTTSKTSLGTFPSGVGMSLFTSTVPTSADYTTITATVGTLKGSTVMTLVPRNCAPGTTTPIDFFFIAPYNAAPTPASAVLSFGTNIQQADVGFVIDSTGSMGNKIANIQSSLSSLASTIKAKVPSVGMGVGDFKSWPCAPDGSSGDYPWKLDQRVVTVNGAGLTAVQNAINGLSATGGFDGPEPDFDAAWFAATGVSNPDCAGGTVPAFNPGSPGASGESTGTIGGMGFRTGSLPIIVLVSDAESHDSEDPNDKNSCPFFGGGAFYGASYAHGHGATLTALQKVGARVIGIASTCGSSDAFTPIWTGTTITTCDATATDGWEPYAQYNWLAEQTKTVVPVAAFGGACGANKCCTDVGGAGMAPDSSGNCPLVYKIAQDGTGLGSSLADAISKLVTFGVMNVGTQISGKTTDEAMPPNPLPTGHTTADFLQPISMLKGVTPLNSTPAVGSPGGPTSIDMATEQFIGVKPGVTVNFTVKVYNDFIKQQTIPQIFKANIQVVGNGTTYLDNRDVWILVPPAAPIG